MRTPRCVTPIDPDRSVASSDNKGLPHHQTGALGPVSGAARVRQLCRWEIACTIIEPAFRRRSAALDNDRRSTTPLTTGAYVCSIRRAEKR